VFGRLTPILRRREREIQILLVELDPESRVERTLHHPLAVHFEDPRRRESAHQRLTDAGRVSAGPRREKQRFADRLDRQRDDDLIGDLARL